MSNNDNISHSKNDRFRSFRAFQHLALLIFIPIFGAILYDDVTHLLRLHKNGIVEPVEIVRLIPKSGSLGIGKIVPPRSYIIEKDGQEYIARLQDEYRPGKATLKFLPPTDKITDRLGQAIITNDDGTYSLFDLFGGSVGVFRLIGAAFFAVGGALYLVFAIRRILLGLNTTKGF